jgi:sugar/nucleoside kinase (ribokinase family)
MNTSALAREIAATPRFDFTLVGDANLDLLLYGLPEDLPMEQELLSDAMALHLGGSGAITAHNLAALGNSVGFTTSLANDELGKRCRAELVTAGVDLSSCVPGIYAQTGVTVVLQHAIRRHMFTYAGATLDLKMSDLDVAYLSNTRHFHMSSYYLLRALSPSIPELFARLKNAGITISLDTNDDPFKSWDRQVLEALQYVDVLLPNEREACLLAQESDLGKAIEFLRGIVPLVVIKSGAAGATAYTSGESYTAPAHPTRVIDAVGAGDSFNAGFLHGWLRGWPIEEALLYGNFTGGWSTTVSGGTAAFQGQDNMLALREAWRRTSAVP